MEKTQTGNGEALICKQGDFGKNNELPEEATKMENIINSNSNVLNEDNVNIKPSEADMEVTTEKSTASANGVQDNTEAIDNIKEESLESIMDKLKKEKPARDKFLNDLYSVDAGMYAGKGLIGFRYFAQRFWCYFEGMSEGVQGSEEEAFKFRRTRHMLLDIVNILNDAMGHTPQFDDYDEINLHPRENLDSPLHNVIVELCNNLLEYTVFLEEQAWVLTKIDISKESEMALRYVLVIIGHFKDEMFDLLSNLKRLTDDQRTAIAEIVDHMFVQKEAQTQEDNSTAIA